MGVLGNLMPAVVCMTWWNLGKASLLATSGFFARYRARASTDSDDAEGVLRDIFEHMFLFLFIWLIHIYIITFIGSVLSSLQRGKRKSIVSVGGCRSLEPWAQAQGGQTPDWNASGEV